MENKIQRKNVIILIVLVCVVGTCMHFVCDVIPEGTLHNILVNIFPANETSWEHMKMIWFPFVVAGIVVSIKYKRKDYFGGFVVSGILAILVQIGLFTIYESFTGSPVLILDIIFYMGDMILSVLLALILSERKWAKALLIWVIVAVIVTMLIVYLTYYPGTGYIFLDGAGLKG